jgi:hypothetical protein
MMKSESYKKAMKCIEDYCKDNDYTHNEYYAILIELENIQDINNTIKNLEQTRNKIIRQFNKRYDFDTIGFNGLYRMFESKK